MKLRGARRTRKIRDSCGRGWSRSNWGRASWASFCSELLGRALPGGPSVPARPGRGRAGLDRGRARPSAGHGQRASFWRKGRWQSYQRGVAVEARIGLAARSRLCAGRNQRATSLLGSTGPSSSERPSWRTSSACSGAWPPRNGSPR